MKTLIAIPCMDMVHTTFFRSMMSLRHVDDVNFAVSCSSLVYDARNTLARRAMAENYDRIMWFDSDMDVPADTMQRLSADLDEGREFVSGIYFRRVAPVKPVFYAKVGYYHMDDKNEVRPIAIPQEDYPKDQIFEVEGVGFGGVMMTVDLLRRVVDKYGAPFAPILGFGEDLSFCMRARDIGEKIYVDSRVKLGHVGLGCITEDVYLKGL